MLGYLLPGHLEVWIILLVAVMLFGPRLPKVMRSLGQAIVEFKKGVKGIEDDVERHSDPKSGEGDASAKSPTSESRSGDGAPPSGDVAG